KKILIVDDEVEVRSVLTIFFDKKGYKTQEAENGEQALEIVRSEDFPVVLLDIDMPVMDGLTTLEKLLEMKPGICVVMVTGRQDEDKVQKALELGAYNYVLKPFEFLYLELIIKSKLDSAESDTSAA
ncbi:MAG: response regulator, partial [Candidatus Omnitrophica bacterium]|nr:response regulator [Candidatus Omnitrophota bacterium]